MSLQELLYLLPIFFIVAFLYASVGHGGASGYLAVFALFSIASPAIAPLALVLNIIVAGTVTGAIIVRDTFRRVYYRRLSLVHTVRVSWWSAAHF